MVTELEKCLEKFNTVFNPDDYETNKLIDTKNNLEMQLSLKLNNHVDTETGPYLLLQIFNVHTNGRDLLFFYGIHDWSEKVFINQYFCINKELSTVDNLKGENERVALRKEELGL